MERLYKERMMAARAGADVSPLRCVYALNCRTCTCAGVRVSYALAAGPLVRLAVVEWRCTRHLYSRVITGAPSLATPSVAAPPLGRRDSRIIQVDVAKVREILQYLSDLEDRKALTEEEVYKLEHLITVNKDQLVLVRFAWARVCVTACLAAVVTSFAHVHAAGLLHDLLGRAGHFREEVPSPLAKLAGH